MARICSCSVAMVLFNKLALLSTFDDVTAAVAKGDCDVTMDAVDSGVSGNCDLTGINDPAVDIWEGPPLAKPCSTIKFNSCVAAFWLRAAALVTTLGGCTVARGCWLACCCCDI